MLHTIQTSFMRAKHSTYNFIFWHLPHYFFGNNLFKLSFAYYSIKKVQVGKNPFCIKGLQTSFTLIPSFYHPVGSSLGRNDQAQQNTRYCENQNSQIKHTWFQNIRSLKVIWIISKLFSYNGFILLYNCNKKACKPFSLLNVYTRVWINHQRAHRKTNLCHTGIVQSSESNILNFLPLSQIFLTQASFSNRFR